MVISKNSILSDEEYLNAQHWLQRPGGKFVLDDDSNSVRHRIWGAKLALLETTFVNYDEVARAGLGICSVFDKITDIQSVVQAIYENSDAKLAFEIKVMYDAAMEYAHTMKIPIDDLVELAFEPTCLPSETPVAFKPPEIWVFGDYGYEDGLLSSPDKLHVDKEGNYLVMDQDITGDNVVQRIQLFSPFGKFMKVILKRGDGKVNGMRDFCLNKNGDLVVADADDQDRARIQIFDYDANQLMMIHVDKDNPDSTPRVLSVFSDEDDNIVCADIGAMCIRVYSPDGQVQAKFGEWGRSDGNFISLQNVTANNHKIYAFDNGVENTKTQVFDYNGKFINKLWSDVTFSQLVFGSDSQIYAVNGSDHSIDKLDLDGTIKKLTGSGYGSTMEDFWDPSSMVFLADGRIAVSERGNHRVKVFKL